MVVGDPKSLSNQYNNIAEEDIKEVSRFIGDAYFKKVEFNKEPLLANLGYLNPFSSQSLSQEPSMCIHKLNPKDQFLILTSDGLWEHLSNQEAVDIVNSYLCDVQVHGKVAFVSQNERIQTWDHSRKYSLWIKHGST